ncbi:MAG: HEAT repeat domain-containing protein [Saprospiraceae bacterium]
MEEQLIKYLNDELSAKERLVVEKQLAQSADWRKMLAELETVFSVMDEVELPTPSAASKTRFTNFLNQEIAKTETQTAKVVKMPFRLWQVAAAVALLVVGVGFGVLFQKNQQQQAVLLQMQQQMDSQRKILVLSMLEKSSASERIKALNISQEESKIADNQVIKAFVELLKNDDNLNVQLKTVEALVHFGNNQQAVNGLIKTLKTINEPLLQIAIIDALVSMQASEAVDGLQRIIQEEETNEIVKQKAAEGLELLI